MKKCNQSFCLNVTEYISSWISYLVGVAVGRYALGRSDLTQLIASMCFGHIIGD